jgi:predicted secreted protein
MPTGFPGRDAALYVSQGGVPETFAKLAGARTTNMTLNNEPVDVTNIDSNGFRELLPDGGVQSMEATISGIVKDHAVYRDVQLQAQQRTLQTYQYRSGNGDIWQASMAIASLQRTGEYNGAETFNITLQSSGDISFNIGS